MSQEGYVSPVGENELLARFVRYQRWIRSDQTVKQDAFIPPRNLELSVTRHIGLSSEELWQIGQAVVGARAEKLYGRADLIAGRVRAQRLEIHPTAEPRNHANITGWPTDKAEQKAIAQELAAAAQFVSA
jgi:hypothetical protein